MRLSILSLLICASTAYAAAACNGNPKLCDRLYSNVTQIGAHDSPFVGELPTDNQEQSVTAQLDSGIRFLQGQTHKNFLGRLDTCHTNCWLEDAGSLVNYLSTINAWLDANQDQVVTLLLTNGDNLPVTNFGDAMKKSGLSNYAFVPGRQLAMEEWPTLQELIDSGHRLVMFLDYGADTSKVPYILDEFTYFFETPFDTTDPNFAQCDLDRPAGASPNGRMYIVNHFLDVALGSVSMPDELRAGTTNSPASIEAQTSLCYEKYGKLPNFVLVDFASDGDVFTAQNQLNGL